MKNILLVLSAVLMLFSLVGFLFLFFMRNSGMGIFLGFGTGMIALDYMQAVVVLAFLTVIFAVLTLKILKWKKTDSISE